MTEQSAKVKLGDRLLIAGQFASTVIALHQNGSIRVRLDDGRETDVWPEWAAPINDETEANE